MDPLERDPTVFPRLTIDLALVRANTERMMAACRGRGVDVMGVTKGVAGDVEVARDLVAGGVTSLGDARLDNLTRLRAARLGVPLWLIRSPSPRQARACVAVADGTFATESETIRALAKEARRRSLVHRVVMMVDLDTGREGISLDDVPEMCAELSSLEGVALEGLGTYFDFKTPPSRQREALRALAAIEVSAPILSGGASNVLELVLDGTLPDPINHLRLGTAPLLGLYTSHGPRPIDGWDRNTVVAEAEVIEVKRARSEAILALGYLDAPMESLFPIAPGMALLRQSSDHTVVSFPDRLSVSDVVRFRLGYNAMSRLASSRYTNVVYRGSIPTK